MRGTFVIVRLAPVQVGAPRGLTSLSCLLRSLQLAYKEVVSEQSDFVLVCADLVAESWEKTITSGALSNSSCLRDVVQCQWVLRHQGVFQAKRSHAAGRLSRGFCFGSQGREGQGECRSEVPVKRVGRVAIISAPRRRRGSDARGRASD